MPPSPGPPPPDWDVISGSTPEWRNAWNDANLYGYDSKNLALYDANSADNFLYFGVSQVTAGHIAWYVRTTADVGSAAPYCKIPQATFNVIKGGTLNSSTGYISYSGHTYQLQVQLDANGNQIAFAYQIS